MPIAKMDNVIKNYKVGKVEVPALRGISLDIQEGEFTSIAGPSGSGKTTMLNLIGCLDKPTSGRVDVSNQDVSKLSSNRLADVRNYNLGFIFQTFNLIPVLSAFENVEFPLILLKKGTPKERKDMAMNMLNELGIMELAHRKPAEMSGGQQQRVAIARALVKGPKIVLADEPTANLDSVTGEGILKLMQDINQKTKTTFIFSTHDPMVMSYARRLVKVHDGKIQADERK
ncbi:MAG: ABC transporter ATP-binding protein [Candidatus Margulisbacteria bacterium]|nr:ABC transporter ATP-binding protein [Candidatus Margulisiibacteriota bacterium]MBU1021862.1 ABC transporter ATP-binding protein [Candidatus Margulisiibacteriota bacterium]MBU1729021.1 ABC transporter ATP-binding protein [Candidatus Margulisiibacteriota bacterium]MBU1954426.1 ABC transporter ATP-binding protein [Candidatus Margulisiibacteriota bacterium]